MLQSAQAITRRRTRTLPGVGFGILLIAGASTAGYPKTMREKTEAACAADVAKFCSGRESSSDQLKACLLQHRAEANGACMKLIDASE